jgi:hypothetical protein
MDLTDKSWVLYRTLVYPQGIPPTQEAECRQAFFAGALSTFNLMQQISLAPEAAAVACVEQLHQELLAARAKRLQELKANS